MIVPTHHLVPYRSIAFPQTITGRFDHVAFDVRRGRAIVAAEKAHALVVVDLTHSRVVTIVRGIAIPHAILYRPDIDRLFVTDGSGAVVVIDAATYRILRRIRLQPDADSIGYDPSTQRLYVDNGGKDAGAASSLVSEVDTTAQHKVADITVPGDRLEAMALDVYRPRLYVNNTARNAVVVIDRWTRRPIATWPLTQGCQNVAITLDEQHERLFVACSDGHIITLDSTTGRELAVVSTLHGIDDLAFDPARHELFAAGDSALAVYVVPHGRLVAASRDDVPTGLGARTGRLLSEQNAYLSAVPARATRPAKLLVFHTSVAWSNPNPSAPFAYDPNAPRAEQIVLATLSRFPFLRKLGLHGIRPGEKVSVLLANGNATRRGIRTTRDDFAAVARSAAYAPLIADGDFYNVKLRMYDAAGRRIGLLVMEIPHVAAPTYAAAVAKANAVRAAVSAQIPSLRSLFAGLP
jgi:hypothetical protein